MQRLLYLLVRIQLYPILRVVDQAHGEWGLEFTPPGLAENPAPQASPQKVQFSLTHGTFEPQQQAVVEVTRVIDPILIQDQRVG